MKISFYVIALFSFSFLLTFSNCKSDEGGGKTSKNIVLETGWYHMVDSTTAGAVKMKMDRTNDYFYFDPTPTITNKHIQEAFLYSGMTNEEGVLMWLTEEGRLLWKEVTRIAQRKYMGFVIDNVLIVTQRIAGMDNGGKTIFYKKGYTTEEKEAIATKLNERAKSYRNKN